MYRYDVITHNASLKFRFTCIILDVIQRYSECLSKLKLFNHSEIPNLERLPERERFVRVDRRINRSPALHSRLGLGGAAGSSNAAHPPSYQAFLTSVSVFRHVYRIYKKHLNGNAQCLAQP